MKKSIVISGLIAAVLFCLPTIHTVCVAEGNGEDRQGESAAPSVIDPIENSDSFSAVLYNNQNGLPTSEANAIVQTADGFIWIASYSGLVRYDGNTFERMDSTDGLANVTNLYVDHNDRLWIGTSDAGLAVMEQGTMRFFQEADGLRSLNISEITEDDQGTIYVSSASGIYLLDEKLNLTPLEDERIQEMYVDILRRGADGLIYGAGNNDDLFVIRSGEVIYYYPHSSYGLSSLDFMTPDPDHAGRVYLAGDGSNFYVAEAGETLTLSESKNIAPLSGVMDIRKIGDRLWIGSRNGIGALDGDAFHDLSHLPMDNSVCDTIADHEGNLWFASTRQGVMKLVHNQFRDLFRSADLPEAVVNSTCMRNGTLFVGTDTGLIVLDDGQVINELPLREVKTDSGTALNDSDLIRLLEGNRIRSILRDSQNRLWISTWRGIGLVCYDGQTATMFTEADGLLSDRVRAINEAADGTILVALTGGINEIKDGKVTGSYQVEDAYVKPEVLTVCSAPNGDILLGSDGDGISIISGKETKYIGTAEGLSSGIVMRIKYDKARNIFWVVTGNSISWLSEDYEIHTVKNFPYSNNFDLYENSNGEMWVLSSDGIYVVSCEELLKDEELHPLHYSMENGLPGITTSNSYSELDKNGNLYISSNTGVVMVNIDQETENVSDMKIGVPYIEADGTQYFANEKGAFVVPSNAQKITVYPHVFSFALTNPQVSYRLDGFEEETVNLPRSSLKPVDYTNLPGGSYHFVMEVRDARGSSVQNKSFVIIKRKKLYEHIWFNILMMAAIAALVFGAVSIYIKIKTRQMELQHQEDLKKEALATELKTAGRIQESMLPHIFPPFPERNEFDLYASMDPAREVGGDFYDYFFIDGDHLCVIIADVSGKGIPASLFMMISKVILQSTAIVQESASRILAITNDTLCANNQAEMFVTVWVGILEISTGRVQAANGGHEFPALMKNGVFEFVKEKHGFVVGGMESMRYPEYEFYLNPGDKLFLYTDGLPDAADANDNMFGKERILETLNRNANCSPKKILMEMTDAVEQFVDHAEQFDDLTMLCIEYKGKQNEEAKASV